MIRRLLVRAFAASAFWLVVVLVWGAGKAQEPTPVAGAPGPAGPLIRDRGKKLFHRPDCLALKRVSPSLRSEVPDLAAASAMGYRPCPVCKPGENLDPDGKPGDPEHAAEPGGSSGSLAFARDIAPVLVGNCIGCHNAQAGARRNNLNMTTFADLLKGGDSGPPIVPGKPEESLIIQRVKGDGVRKMPPNQRDLAEPTIAKLAAWIRQGARLDEGIDPSAALKSYAAKPDDIRRGDLARKKPEELDRQTEQTGFARWKQASSSVPTVTPGGRFLLFSKLPPERARNLLKTLDAQVNPLRVILQGVPESLKVLAGPEKISLYVFDDEKGYIAFVRANENREVEAGTHAHANLGVESPYLAAVDPLKGGEEPKATSSRKSARRKRPAEPTGPDRTLAGLLSEQLGSGVAASSGQAPRWLSLGLGAWTSSQVEPRSGYYRGLRAEVANLYLQGWVSKTRELLAGEGDTDRIRAVGFSLLEFLGASNRAFIPVFIQGVVQDPRQFDDLIQQNLGASPDEFFQAWGSFVATRYGRGR
jgi:mono/diheme cytochrome c family protein